MRPKYYICPECGGEGVTVHPAFSIWTYEDIQANPLTFEKMMHGEYNITCPRCKGLRVVDHKREKEWTQERGDHFQFLRESGIYPGSPDYF